MEGSSFWWSSSSPGVWWGCGGLPCGRGSGCGFPQTSGKYSPDNSNNFLERRRKMGTLKPFSICALFIGFTFFLLPGLAQPQERVKIGVCAPLTGALAHTGRDIVMGAEVAAYRINAAGGITVAEKKVQLEIMALDDQFKPDLTVT